MAVYSNTIGTTNRDFTIGKKGLTMYPSGSNPVGGGGVKAGDFWFDLDEKSLRFRTTENDAWILPALDDLRITGNAILSGARYQNRTAGGDFVTRAEVTQDIVLYASGTGAILVDNDSDTPKIEVPSDKHLLLHAGDTANGVGGDLILAAGQALGTGQEGSIVLATLKWPNQDGTTGQVLTTDGAGQLSWATVGTGSGDPIGLNDLIDVSTTGAVNNDSLTFNGSTWVPMAGGAGGIASVEDDPAPKLGGELDVNGYAIKDMTFDHKITLNARQIMVKPLASSSQSEIIIEPTASSGSLSYGSVDFKSAATESAGYIRFAEEGVLSLPGAQSSQTDDETTLVERVIQRMRRTYEMNQVNVSNPQMFMLSINKDLVMYSTSDDATEADTAVGSKDNVRIFTDVAGGDVHIQGLKYPKVDGTSSQVLTTDGAGQLYWTENESGGSSTLGGLTDVSLSNTAVSDIIKFNGIEWRNEQNLLANLADIVFVNVQEGQYLKRNGVGWINSYISKTDISDADWISSVVDDVTPQLGGDLDVKGYQLVDSSGSGVVLNGVKYPDSDGQDGEVLTTNGAGEATFQPLPTSADAQFIPITVDSNMLIGRRYVILNSVTATLPDYSTLQPGDNVRVGKKANVDSTVQAYPGQEILLENGNTVGSIDYNKAREMLMIFDGTQWSLLI